VEEIWASEGGTNEKSGEICVLRSSVIFTLHQKLLRWFNQGGWDWCSMCQVRGKREAHVGFW